MFERWWARRGPHSGETAVKSFKLLSLIVCLAALGIAVAQTATSPDGKTREERFRHSGVTAVEASIDATDRATEAPTGFDNRTNGFNAQGPAFDTLNEDNVSGAALLQRQPLHLRGSGSRRRRARPDLQRAELLASAIRTWRPAARARSPSIAPAAWATATCSSNRSADRCAFARDASRHRRARGVRGRRPHVPHLHQHAGQRIRRGDRERDAARHPRSRNRRRCAATR